MDGNELKQVLDAFAELRGEVRGEMAGLRGEFTELRGEFTELRGEMAELRSEMVELRAHVDATATETRAHVDATATETRRHFEVALEGLNLGPKFELIAEIVRAVDEKLDREAASIRAEMRQGFADTQAMIGFSNTQLGNRITALENAHG